MHMKSFTIINGNKEALIEMEDKNGVTVKFHPVITPELLSAINIFCNNEYNRWRNES